MITAYCNRRVCLQRKHLKHRYDQVCTLQVQQALPGILSPWHEHQYGPGFLKHRTSMYLHDFL